MRMVKQSTLTGVARELAKARIKTLEIEFWKIRKFRRIELDSGEAHYDKGWDAEQWGKFWEQQLKSKRKQYDTMLHKLAHQLFELRQEFPEYKKVGLGRSRPPPRKRLWFV